MQGIPMDYHVLFLTMVFVLFIITILLLFIDATLTKTVGANIIIMVNFILCLIVSLGFGAIDMYSYDANGVLVHNVSDVWVFVYIFWAFSYINVMLLFYCVYIYIRKPWEQYDKKQSPF